MSVLFIVLPLALVIVLIAVGAYVWSARTGQFDDLDTPALRMLHDDDGSLADAHSTDHGQRQFRSRSSER